jgi:hypothetical protein
LLAFFGIATAVWLSVSPSLSLGGGGSSSTQVPVEVRPIVINVPVPGLPEVELPGIEVSGQTITIEPVVALISLTMFILGGIVITGIIIAVLYTFLDKMRNKTLGSDEYRGHEAALSNKEQTYFKEVRQGRQAHPAPDSAEMPRWAVVSTSAIILIFVALIGMVISLTFWPHWIEIIDDSLRAPGLAVISVLCLITLVILIWRMSPNKIEKVEASGNGGIPRDTIAIILTGLLIVGLGIGFTIYINLP